MKNRAIKQSSRNQAIKHMFGFPAFAPKSTLHLTSGPRNVATMSCMVSRQKLSTYTDSFIVLHMIRQHPEAMARVAQHFCRFRSSLVLGGFPTISDKHKWHLMARRAHPAQNKRSRKHNMNQV